MSIYITSVSMTNWLAYSGTQSIELGPEVYAITAETEADVDRSNGVGKTALLEAMKFALTGEHRKRTEDEWITRGAPEGGVELGLSDGTKVRRWRKRGKSTQLHVGDATGPSAQVLLDDLMGLSGDDFAATTWFRQKGMSEIVDMRPGPRTELVNTWLRLGKLKACEKNAQARLAAISAKEEKLRMLLGHVLAEATAKGEDYGNQLCAMEAAADARLKELAASISELGRKLDARAALVAIRDQAAEYDAIVAEGVSLKARTEELKKSVLAEDWIERSRENNGVVDTAGREVTRLEQLIAGTFDGTCPVNCERCPIADSINERGRQHEFRINLARLNLERRQGEAEVLELERISGMQAKSDLDRAESRLGVLRERLIELRPAKQQAETLGLEGDTEELEDRRETLFLEHTSVQQWLILSRAELQRLRVAEERVAEEQARIELLKPELELRREAVVIFKAAQRKIAEAAMGEVEADANSLLSAIGVDLSLRLSWARDTAKGLAEACDQCGAPYPASQRVKSCTGCGARRGPKQVEELTLELSDQSGALDILASIAFRLAARAWLCRERGIRWGVVALDEPLASFDRANRQAFAIHVVAMLRRQCQQAFLVSHDSEATNLLPGRIVVRRALDGSRTVQVV